MNKFVVFAIAACLMAPAYSINLNIHFKVEEQMRLVIEGSLINVILQKCPHSEVNFTYSQPHVTLYLTEFEDSKLDEIQAKLDEIAPSLPHNCQFEYNSTELSGNYFMWNLAKSECLQQLSDQVVNALAEYRVKDQVVPEWVYSQPEPKRTKMINYVKNYGSPNVFDLFAPHVTLAWDAVDDMTVLTKYTLPTVDGKACVLALGRGAEHGMIRRNKDVKQWSLT